ncbi:MAG TPA: hypothetical protein ENJ32_12950 [Crenotrichaceae bacterium]|nr:hypothetical protein [Crenotrichaceae bacterium]
MVKKTIVSLITILLSIGAGASNATTPKDAESLKIQAAEPTISGDSAISISVLWRIDDKMRYSGTGLTFINGPDTRKPDNAVSVASKMVTSIKESMMAQEPSWRGAEVKQVLKTNGDKTASLIVNNKQGHSLNEFVIRDYSNQAGVSYQVKPSFSVDGVNLAIDMVYAESADGSNPFLSVGKKKTKNKKAQGGGIEIKIADHGAVVVETANQSTEEIEKKLASAFSNAGGFVSGSQLFADVKDGTTRNVKPFDGSEVQFKSLKGNAVKVTVKDPSVAAIIKLKYPDENNTMIEIPMPLVFLVLVGVVGGVGYFYWKSQKEAQENVV